MSKVALAQFKAALDSCQQVEPGRRLRDIDGRIENDRTRRVKFYADGSLLTVERDPNYEPYQDERQSKRGKVSGFTHKSRKRFLVFVASLSRHVMPLFVTLTYPESWPGEWQHWKEHLNRWWNHCVERKWKCAASVWKLEPQERGAPHFHLMIWGIPFMPHEWLAQSWYEIVGSNDPRHLKAGTSVERVRSYKGVMSYCGKKYLGKEVRMPKGWENVGRFWGVMGRKHLPRSRVLEFTVSKGAAARFARLIRRKLASQGIRWSGRNVSFFTQSHYQWARAMDWCEGGAVHGIDFTRGLEPEEACALQPF